MILHRFVLRLDQPPLDGQVQRLFAAVGDACVEVGAWRGWATVAVDRAAPSLADAIAAAIRDLDAVGLVPVDAGPDDDLVPLSFVAERVGCSPRAVHRWAAGESGPGGFPAPVDLPDPPCGPPYYRWSDIVAWLHGGLGLRPPDNEAVFAAVDLVLRLRAIAPRVERMAVIRSLL